MRPLLAYLLLFNGQARCRKRFKNAAIRANFRFVIVP